MNDLNELLEHVKATTGPDREIDADLFSAFGEGFLLWDDGEPLFVKGAPSSFRQTRYDVPEYTASIDAALALVDRVLPSWVVSDLCQNSRHAGDPWGCELSIYYGSDPSKNRSAFSGWYYSKPALAILVAFLTALIAQESSQ